MRALKIAGFLAVLMLLAIPAYAQLPGAFDGQWLGAACPRNDVPPVAVSLSIDGLTARLRGIVIDGEYAPLFSTTVGTIDEGNFRFEFPDDTGRMIRFSLVQSGTALSGTMKFIGTDGTVIQNFQILLILDDTNNDLPGFYRGNVNACSSANQ